MPITYEIDAKSAIIRVRSAGDVTVEEIMQYFERLGADPRTPDRSDVIADLSEQTWIPQSSDLRTIIREMGKLRSRFVFEACAIVAPTDAIFGMSRMFEVFSEDYFEEVRVFRSLVEAELWLAERRKLKQGPKTPAAR